GGCRKILCCAALSCLIILFASSTRAESYARVCATTVDAESNETLLTEKSAPAPGEKLLVHMDASAECDVSSADILVHLQPDPESRRYFVFFVEALRLK